MSITTIQGQRIIAGLQDAVAFAKGDATKGKVRRRKLMRDPKEVLFAHMNSSRHRDEIEASTVCGCFCCLYIFPSTDVVEWTDYRNRRGTTAICPKCGVDAILGDASGYPIDTEFLGEMQRYWFGIV